MTLPAICIAEIAATRLPNVSPSPAQKFFGRSLVEGLVEILKTGLGQSGHER